MQAQVRCWNFASNCIGELSRYELPFFSSRDVVFHGALSELVRPRNGTKKAAAHTRNSGLRPEILFGSVFHSRASAENPVLNQATAVISDPVGRPPLSRQPFLMLLGVKQLRVTMTSFFKKWIIRQPVPLCQSSVLNLRPL